MRRNGYRDRVLDTRLASLQLRTPTIPSSRSPRGSNQSARLHLDGASLQIGRDPLEQHPIQPCAMTTRRKRTKAVRSGMGSLLEATETSRRGTILESLGELDVGQIMPHSQQLRLEHCQRRRAGSPLLAG
jgi:hypothetical protein